MEYEILAREPDVSFTPTKVSFPAFERYREQAAQIAEYIGAIEVTPENVKEVKKTLAQARKITDGLSRKRIDIKRAILQDFATFEEQVKELAGIVDEADSRVRAMVRELEEQERQRKKEQLREVWDKRATMYETVTAFIPDPFEAWLQPKHLNKSTSVAAAEKDMVEWLEKKTSELETMTAMGTEYLAAYVRTGDTLRAIQEVKDAEQVREAAEAAAEPAEETAAFIVKGAQMITLTELLLKTNKITYQRR